MSERVLVTGGAGFIGSHVAMALAKAGRQPVVYDSLSRGNRKAVQFGPLEEGDVRDVERLTAAMKRHRIAGVIHMAAFAYVRESVENPLLYYDNNVIGSIRLVQAMQAAGVGRIVFSSTCAIYGMPSRLPIEETDATLPISPYGASKLMMERVLSDAEPRGIRSVSLRYFNAAGSDPEGRIGEWHRPETHIIPSALMAARGEIPALTLFGDRHPTPDGTTIRDYVHVQDLADAHVHALDYLGRGGKSDIFNLGGGNGHSIRDIVASVQRVTGLGVPHKVVAANPGDPPILVASGDKARRTLGFAPKLTRLDDMIAHAWVWRQKAQAAYGS